MFKKFFIIVCALMLVLVAGCQNGTDNTEPYDKMFIGGNAGVIAEFTQSGMMDEGIETVWVGNDFPIEVIFRNKGEYTVPEGELKAKLIGIDTDFFGIENTEAVSDIDIEKVSEYNNRGGEVVLSFSNANVESMKTPYIDASMIVSYEYLYKTYAAVPDICFKADYREEKVCEVDGAKTVFTSGAPVAVTKVTQSIYGSKRIAVTFDVENVGNGVITTPEGDFDPYQQKLEFELVEGNEDGIFECTSLGSKDYAMIRDRKTSIVCKSDVLPDDALYVKQLTMELSYKYKDDISKRIRVMNNPE